MDYTLFQKYMHEVYQLAMSDEDIAAGTFVSITFNHNSNNVLLYNKIKEETYNKYGKSEEEKAKANNECAYIWANTPLDFVYNSLYLVKDDTIDEYVYVAVDKTLHITVNVKDWTKYCSLDEFIKRLYNIMTHYQKKFKLNKYFDWKPSKEEFDKKTRFSTTYRGCYPILIQKYTDDITCIDYWPKADWDADYTIEENDHIWRHSFCANYGGLFVGPAFPYLINFDNCQTSYLNAIFDYNMKIVGQPIVTNNYPNCNIQMTMNSHREPFTNIISTVQPDYVYLNSEEKFLSGIKHYDDKINVKNEADIDFIVDYIKDNTEKVRKWIKLIPHEAKRYKIKRICMEEEE